MISVQIEFLFTGTYLLKASYVGWSLTSRDKHSHFTAAIAPVIMSNARSRNDLNS